VHAATLRAFGEELSKIAAGVPWVAQEGRALEKTRLRVAYHFSPRAGGERWDRFLRNVADPGYVAQLAQHPDVDQELLRHAKSLHEMSQGRTVGKVYSNRLPGRSYEVRELADGTYGCTCPDWRYVGSLKPGYECKHIKAYRAGNVKAED
jgi:hypothetical protein